MFPQRNEHGYAISMLARSISCYVFACAAILTVCVEAAKCADRERHTPTVIELSAKQLRHLYPELEDLKSADTQTELPMILKRVGANEVAFLRNLPNLTAREDIVVQEEEQADIGGADRAVPVFSGKYTYLVLTRRGSDGVHLLEYRTDLKGKEVKPGLDRAPAITEGFALVALLFDPFHQVHATFRFLGRQMVDRGEMYVVAFAQQSDGTQLTGQISIGGKTASTAYQGIAWVDPVKFQIRQMRTDLLEPRPDVGLRVQTTEVKFMEVHLPTVETPLWLPRSVVVSSLSNGRLVRNRHSYHNYQRFVANSRIVPAK